MLWNNLILVRVGVLVACLLSVCFIIIECDFGNWDSLHTLIPLSDLCRVHCFLTIYKACYHSVSKWLQVYASGYASGLQQYPCLYLGKHSIVLVAASDWCLYSFAASFQGYVGDESINVGAETYCLSHQYISEPSVKMLLQPLLFPCHHLAAIWCKLLYNRYFKTGQIFTVFMRSSGTGTSKWWQIGNSHEVVFFKKESRKQDLLKVTGSCWKLGPLQC